MKRIAPLLIPIFLSSSLLASSQGQRGGDKTSYVLSFGKVILATSIKVDLDNNDVVLRDGTNITHLPASKVQKVISYEVKTGRQEVYYAGTFGINSKPYIFRVLADGSLPLLYREGVKFSQFDESEYPPYFILKDGQIYSLGTSKKEILAVFDTDMTKAMTDFVKQNKVNVSNDEGLTHLFEHYNVHPLVATN